jgi:glycine/D-amino acid oxidase-like deaminating enzyme
VRGERHAAFICARLGGMLLCRTVLRIAEHLWRTVADVRGSCILVVGGGIGGLACALALSQRGLCARVLEQAPAFGEIGAGIQLGPNMVRALGRLGLKDRVLADAWTPNSLVLRDALDGSQVTCMRVCGLARMKRQRHKFWPRLPEASCHGPAQAPRTGCRQTRSNASAPLPARWIHSRRPRWIHHRRDRPGTTC